MSRRASIPWILLALPALIPSAALADAPTAPTPCPDWVDQTYTSGKAAVVWNYQDPPANFPSSGDNFEQRDISGIQQSRDQGVIWSVGDRRNNRPDITGGNTVTGAAATGISSNWRIYAHDVSDGSLEGMFSVDPDLFLIVDNRLEDGTITQTPDGAAEFPDAEEIAIDYRNGKDRLYIMDTGDDYASRGNPNIGGGVDQYNYPVIYRFDEPVITVDGTVDSSENRVLTPGDDGLKRYDLRYYDGTDDATATQLFVNAEAGFFDSIKPNPTADRNTNLFMLTRKGEDLGVGVDTGSDVLAERDDHRVFRVSAWHQSDGGTTFTRAEQVAVVDIPVSGAYANDTIGNAVFGADMRWNDQAWVIRNGERAFVWTRYVKADGDCVNVGAEMNAHPLAEELPSATDQSCSSTLYEFDYIQSNNNEEALAYRYSSGGATQGFYGTQDQTATPQPFETLNP